ncbi:MAG: T9SS C-terminal target domain-containing protein [Ignavibacteriae bacterium]|nr:MAG: T9SS C-terminal target domain-containing protein [Ignavibacteriota bacterium]
MPDNCSGLKQLNKKRSSIERFFVLFVIVFKMKTNKIIFLLLFIPVTFFSQFYTADTLITNLSYPVAFAFLPDGNVMITLKEGPVKIYTLNNTIVSQVWNFTDSCVSDGERGVLGICADPQFTVNRYIYIYYVHAIPPLPTEPQWLRVVRLTLNANNTGGNPFIVFNHPVEVIGCCHVGGNVHFGHDGKLYLTLGETNNQPAAQSKVTPLGKILRMNSNGTAPTDNPFYDDGNPNSGNDDRIWCMGLRNSFDFCFSPINDSLYATENGLITADEVNYIRKGKNYGWPICEGYCNPPVDSFTQPMHTWSPTIAVTGIMVYQGTQYPELNGRLLVADNKNGRIYKCELGRAPAYDTIISRTQIIELGPLTSLMQGTDGFIYVLNGGYEPSGKLHRIRPSSIGVNNNQQEVPGGFVLYQNYPNPFNPKTIINYQLTMSNYVMLTIYDLIGREVAVLVSQKQNEGNYKVEWDASNYPSGVYFYKLTVRQAGSSTGNFSAEKKMVLLK